MHDSVLCEVPQVVVEQTCQIVTDAMEAVPTGFSVPLTLSKLMEHIPMRRPNVARHLAALSNSHSAEICGEYRGGSKWRSSCWNQG
jgi:hypothetical protein